MDDKIREVIEADEKRVQREEELMNDCRLNAYQLSLAVEQVASLKEKRKELFRAMREANFTNPEIAELANISSKRVQELTAPLRFS